MTIKIEEVGIKNCIQPEKLVAKIPMEQIVIDNRGGVFAYKIFDKHVQYAFIGYVEPINK